jgi:hypothetical protein
MATAIPTLKLLLLKSDIELWEAKVNVILSKKNVVRKLHYLAVVMFNQDRLIHFLQ